MISSTEKSWKALANRPFTQNGTKLGLVTVADTVDLHVKQKIILNADTLNPKDLEIKFVISKTQLIIGPINAVMSDTEDLTTYILLLNPYLEIKMQTRPAIDEKSHERAVYEEEPIMAKRNVLVDKYGEFYDVNNPLQVQLGDGNINIGTVNAELEVQLSHKDNIPNVGDVADSVQIGDGVETLLINPDGSINVVTSTSSTNIPTIENFDVITANTEYSYTFPLATKQFSFRDRKGDAKTKIAYIPTNSLTEYITIYPGNIYNVDNISTLSGFTIYFNSNKDNRVIEILSWR